MRRHAKASSAGSTMGAGKSRNPIRRALATRASSPSAGGSGAPSRSRLAVLALAIAAITLALGATLTQAGSVDTWQLTDSFDGSAAPAGSFAGPERMAIDQGADLLYVLDSANGQLLKYDISGAPTPANFSALSSPAINGAGGGDPLGDADETPQGELGLTIDADIAVDNSGTATDGNVYVASEFGFLYAFDSAGDFLWEINGSDDGIADPDATPTESLDNPCGVAVDDQGDVYVAGYFAEAVRKFSPQAGTAAYLSEINVNASSCHIAVDSDENLYAAHYSSDVEKFDSTGASQGIVDPGPANSVSVNPANDRLYVDHETEIVEYDSSGAQLHSFGAEDLGGSLGLAARASSGEVFASDASDQQVHVFDFVAVTLPDVTVGQPDPIGSEDATLKGTVDPLGVPTSYFFEYREAGSENWIPTPTVDAGSSPGTQNVSAAVEGLLPNTEYEARLTATNTDVELSEVAGPITFTTVPGLPVLGDNPSGASEIGATLAAWVNPRNSATTYRFEYGKADCETSSCASTAIQNAGPGNEPVFATADLNGLETDTTYHYRLVATNAAGTTEGRDRTILTSTGLPEGRAYELVSPADKQGKDVLIEASRSRAATDGDAFQFSSLGAFADAIGTGISTEYIAQRSDDPDPGDQGWSTHAITPAMEPQDSGAIFQTFDPRYMGELSDDLSTGVYVAKSQLSAEGGNVATLTNLYARRDLLTPGAGSYALQSDAVAALAGSPNERPSLTGTSTDFHHVVFAARRNLTVDAPAQPAGCTATAFNACRPRVYESVDGVVTLAGLVPPSSDTECIDPDCVAPIRSIGGRAAASDSYNGRAVSEDGSRIFFTVAPGTAASANAANQGDLYVREDGTSTTKINVSERAAPEASQPAKFWDASTDGRYVFFTTAERLTDDDVNGNEDLYRADLDQPAGSRLTLISSDADPRDGGGSVPAVIGSSEDGEWVYFAATSQLVPGGPPSVANEMLLFAWHAGENAYVGSISQADEVENSGLDVAGARKQARVMPDGRRLLFSSRSHNSLVGYDNADACPASRSERPCREVYLFDATANGGAGALACVSCRPDGVTATRDASTVATFATGGANRSTHLNTAITDDGERVFFTTAERLLPTDINGVEDAYEYDTDSGQLRLLSSGEDPAGSYFLDASSDGRDVFIVTRERLSGWDTDANTDVYDVRIGGGFPEPPPMPPSCQGDACQPVPAVINDPTPSSSAFAGPGSQVSRGAKPRECPKGKRRVKARGGKSRCMKRKGAKRKNRAKHNRRASR